MPQPSFRSSPVSTFALIVLVLSLLLGGCMTHEQKMVLKVDRWMAQERYDSALSYLEGYLARHDQSLAGWRYRVLIRLEQGVRATAAAEYADLSEALGRHEPEVLREVVLGAGGRWLLSDYQALARCGTEPVVTPALFEDLLEPKMLGRAELAKVAVAEEQIGGVLGALPGRLEPAATWPLVYRFAAHESSAIRARVVSSAGRHLAAGTLDEQGQRQALDVLGLAAGDGEASLREAALLASLRLPAGEGRASFAASIVSSLWRNGDKQRANSGFLLGPGATGPSGWATEALLDWGKADSGALRILAVGELHRRSPKKAHRRVLTRALRSAAPSERLAAALSLGKDTTATWQALSLDDQRTWGPVFARTAAPEHDAYTVLALGATDGLVAQGTAGALALGGFGDRSSVDAALDGTLGAADASTRARAARAAVVREATSLTGSIEALFRRDDDRVLMDVLRTLVETGSDQWPSLPALALSSSLSSVRELAVDALVADCSSGSRATLVELLDDEDPHVAVRAAAGLYLLVGSGAAAEAP